MRSLQQSIDTIEKLLGDYGSLHRICLVTASRLSESEAEARELTAGQKQG